MPFDPAFTSSYLVAFIMGLFSSMHCIGMCGSIIGTLTLSLSPEIRNNKKRLLPFVFNYNLGRITSYAIAGGLVGAIEALLTVPLGETHGHRILQLLSAAIMTGAGLYIAGWFPRFAYIEKAGTPIWKKLEPYGRKLIPVKNHTHAYLFGMVWGWLPCGLVYAALALAATKGDAVNSALTMLAFGLGTLPAVMGVGIMTNLLTRLSRMTRFKQAIGLFMMILALLAAFPWLNPMAFTSHMAMH
jgi:sulfite exporter TauE/SafE